jgi:hypothetical protein
MTHVKLVKSLNDPNLKGQVNAKSFCPKWESISIKSIRKGIDLYKCGGEGKYFKVETLRWNTNPSKYTLDDITSEYKRLPENFKSLTSSYTKGILETKKKTPSFFSSFFSFGSKVINLPKDSNDALSSETGSVTTRKALTHNIKMAVWCEEELITKDFTWKGKPWITHNTRLCFACLNTVTADSCHVAHIIPYVNGGKDEVKNLRISCAGCNSGSGGMSTFHAYEWLINTKKPGLKFMDINDPNYTTALLIHNYHTMCYKLSKDLPSLKAPLNERITRYKAIMDESLN